MRILAALLALVAIVAAQDPPAETSVPEVVRTLDWFDRLPLTDVRKCPYVRVTTGVSGTVNGEPWIDTQDGFLLEETDEAITILTLWLNRVSIEKKDPRPDGPRVGYEKLDIVGEVRAILKDEDEPHRFKTFALAWACRRKGHESLALDLATRAARVHRHWDKGWRFRKLIAEDLALSRMAPLITGFQEGTPRKELLAGAHFIVDHLEGTTYYKRARMTAELLQMMIAEDEAHAKSARPLSEMTTEEQIRELIFRLRDQVARQWSSPGRCYFLGQHGFGDGGDTSAGRLVKLGPTAVPLLIEALTDRRFTRGVGYWRGHTFSHYVLRVGDCAREILEHIAGRTFYNRRTSSGEIFQDDAAPEVQQRARAWWAEFREKGELKTLVDGVAAGTNDSLRQAYMLIERFPDETLAALTRGIRASGSPWLRHALVGILGWIKDKSPVPFLNEEMTDGPHRLARVTAAEILQDRGDPRAVPAMIGEWKRFAYEGFERNDGKDELIRFLTTSPDIAAIAALRDGWPERDIRIRYDIIESILGADWPSGRRPVQEGPARDAIEDLLVFALADDDLQTGVRGTREGGRKYSDPRICDLAGHALWWRWKERYAFDLGAPIEKRDRRILDLKAAWRRTRGLDDLARRLSLVVRKAKVLPRSLAVKGRFQSLLESLEGKPLTVSGYVAILQAYLDAPPEGVDGHHPRILLSAVRNDDDSGVEVGLHFEPWQDDGSGGPDTVLKSTHVEIDGNFLCRESGVGSWSLFNEYDGLRDLSAAIRKVLAAPPEKSFLLRVTIRVQAGR